MKTPTPNPDKSSRWGLILVALATGISIVALDLTGCRALPRLNLNREETA